MTPQLHPNQPSSLETLHSGLPSDVQAEASRRLVAVGVLMAGLATLGLLMRQLVIPVVQGQADFPHAEPHSAKFNFILMGLSASMASFAQWSSYPPRVKLNVGGFYMVVVALVISLQDYYFDTDYLLSGVGLTWVAVWILLYPTIVPSTTRRTAITAFAAATTGPVAFLLGVATRDNPMPSTGQFVLLFFGIYLCAWLSVIPSRVHEKMAKALRKARELGSYELTELLGKGGMGEVWRARHRLLARPAAVKLIRADRLGDSGSANSMLQRFEREAQATAALQSPHTIELFDFGVARDGTFYYVMELLEGINLEVLVQRFGPVPPGRAVMLLRQACHSLADAHHAGMVHRDIKPANLFACRLGLDHDFVKVLDFGLVKSEFGAIEGDTFKTAVGVTTGTPAFMAPELALGRTDIDARVDIYALGCVAFWLLSGRLVFQSENPMEMMVMHAREEPIAVSSVIEGEIPPELDSLIDDCLKKDPAARPASAEVLAARLAAVPVEEWSVERAATWWEKHLPRSELGQTTATGLPAADTLGIPVD